MDDSFGWGLKAQRAQLASRLAELRRRILNDDDNVVGAPPELIDLREHIATLDQMILQEAKKARPD